MKVDVGRELARFVFQPFLENINGSRKLVLSRSGFNKEGTVLRIPVWSVRSVLRSFVTYHERMQEENALLRWVALRLLYHPCF